MAWPRRRPKENPDPLCPGLLPHPAAQPSSSSPEKASGPSAKHMLAAANPQGEQASLAVRSPQSGKPVDFPSTPIPATATPRPLTSPKRETPQSFAPDFLDKVFIFTLKRVGRACVGVGGELGVCYISVFSFCTGRAFTSSPSSLGSASKSQAQAVRAWRPPFPTWRPPCPTLPSTRETTFPNPPEHQGNEWRAGRTPAASSVPGTL